MDLWVNMSSGKAVEHDVQFTASISIRQIELNYFAHQNRTG
jgi:hypothetical protein